MPTDVLISGIPAQNRAVSMNVVIFPTSLVEKLPLFMFSNDIILLLSGSFAYTFCVYSLSFSDFHILPFAWIDVITFLDYIR